MASNVPLQRDCRDRGSDESDSSGHASTYTHASSHTTDITTPSPPQSRSGSMSQRSKPPWFSTLAVVNEARTDTAQCPTAWSDKADLLEAAATQYQAQLNQYSLAQFTWMLRKKDGTQFILRGFGTRFFIWRPFDQTLLYIRTLSNLLGIYRALDTDAYLETQSLASWHSTGHFDRTMLRPCPAPHRPKPWEDDPDELLSTLKYCNIRHFGLNDPFPLLVHNGHSTDEDITFLQSQGGYYLYFTFNDVLLRIVSPDMSDTANW